MLPNRLNKRTVLLRWFSLTVRATTVLGVCDTHAAALHQPCCVSNFY